MKKQTLISAAIIVVFVLFVTLSTLFTMLDAFVFDRVLEGSVITGDPSFTLGPKETSAFGTSNDTSSPEGVNGSSPNTPSAGTDSAVTGGSQNTVETDSESTPDTTTATPDTTTPPPEVEYPILGDMYYKDENIEIAITENYFLNENDVYTRYFVVDIRLTDVEYLRTYFKMDEDGEVIKDTTSDLAEECNAIFAVNGDFFSFRERGFVIRNGIPYRSSARKSRDGDDALFILPDGTLVMYDENDRIFKNGLPSNVYQCFSFGPRLVEYGEIVVDEDSEVGQHAASNPRTAIGMVEPLHYKIVVSEGRLVDDDGLTLLELATLMESLGCDTAYNLDGGSSTTLYFNGEVINTPGRDDGSERSISDIIYINGKTRSEES